MALGIVVEREDLETLFVRLHLSGMTSGDRYDVYRMTWRSLGKDDSGDRVYERELPDRRAIWSAVAHRIGWQAPGANADFRDYETPRRPTRWFVVRSDAIAPFEYDFGDGPYPLSRGALTADLVHFNGELADLNLDEEPDEGHVVVRSVHELAHYAECCVVDMEGPTYGARVSEFAVMGSQYPAIVADSREARRGVMTLMTRNLGQLNALRRVVYPANGRIRPFIVNSGGDSTMLLDDMRCLPLDVEVEQATQRNADWRYVHISYAEVDPSAPLIARSGDNDSLVSEPQANFTISDTTPNVNQWITLQDTSSGQGDTWSWELERGHETDNKVGVFYTQGPHRVRWSVRGKKSIKLRFGGSGAGFHTRTKTIQVG